MTSKNNYPSERKATPKVICPICKGNYHVRGIKNHLKLTHGYSILEIEKVLSNDQLNFNSEVKRQKKEVTPAFESHFALQIEALLQDLTEAYRLKDNNAVESVIGRIGFVRHRMSWPIPDIDAEALALSKKYFIGEPANPQLFKKLVVRLSDGSTRDIDSRDYYELSRWMQDLKEKKDEINNKIERYRNPVLREIEFGHR